MDKEKTILILAGPNGAGKTTFAQEFFPNEAGIAHFVNADLIAAGLSPFDPSLVAVRAGRLMLERIEELVARGESFGFETTLAGLGYAQRIPVWQGHGYRVMLVFLRLSSVEVAIGRVAERVSQGGHDIPEEVIRRRFQAGIRNFELVYREIVDSWVLYDNEGGLTLVAEGEK